MNRLAKVAKNNEDVASYIYDESGLRLKKQGKDKAVYYVFDTGGNVLYEQDNREYLEYVYVLGKHFARIDGNLDNLAETTKYFYHTDHLGSTVLVTDEAGQQVWSSEYTPFGKQVSKEGEMDHVTQFTGKDLDEDTGLYYFNARWMDSELGRFISEDPLAQDPNLYSYSGNNPISRIDPSGLWYYEVDPDSGEMIATAEEDDTLSGLSSQYYGSTDYINQIATDNEIADADSIQEGQRFVLGDYTERAGKFHGSALRQSFINGDISYDALKTFSALYKLSNALEFNKEERQIIADIQNYFALAHSKGEITGEQLVKVRDYYGGWEFVDKNYGVTTANATGDELLVLGGMAAYRLAKVFGPMIWSSPFVQKLITNDTAKNPQVTVLGKWTEISIYKGSQYYNVLSINPTVYRVLEKFKLGWEANKLWLDRCAARGDIFFLGSEPYAWLGKGTAYSKELQYMYELGYRFIGNYLVKQ